VGLIYQEFAAISTIHKAKRLNLATTKNHSSMIWLATFNMEGSQLFQLPFLWSVPVFQPQMNSTGINF